MNVNVVLVSGNFNVLHPGHMRLLRFAREFGGRLFVGVYSDHVAGTAAYIPEQLRLDGVASNALVDEAFLINSDIKDVILRLRPDVVIKGKEHEYGFNAELEALEKYGGRLLFGSGETTFSSKDLLEKELFYTSPKSINLPNKYMDRRGISSNKLKKLVGSFSSTKVCIIGDLIIDEYIECQPLGMSQEDPTIVVSPQDSTNFIGGAGIVAAHAAGMGAKVQFVSVIGDDSFGELSQEKLAADGVIPHLLVDDTRPTTLKQRYRCQGKTLLRVSHLRQASVSQYFQTRLLELMEQALFGADLVVFSDFNYGCLPQPLVDEITSMAKSRGLMLAADSQSSSQMGDISRFHGMDLVTPTEREARIALRSREDGLVILAERLRRCTSAENVILKMGSEGILIHSTGGVEGQSTDKIGALNSAPKDVAGAGDSLLITSALALASGGNIWDAACIGSLAAAVQVGRVGNTPLNVHDILNQLKP